MGSESVVVATKSAGKGIFSKIIGNLGFFKIFRVLFIFLFFVLPIIQGVLIGIETKSTKEGVNYLFPKLLQPTLTLQANSIKIMAQNGLYEENSGFFSMIWQSVKSIYGIWQPLWITYEWVMIITFFLIFFFVQDTSKRSAGVYVLAIVLMFLIQNVMLFSIGTNDDPITTPYKAIFWDFPRAMMVVITNYTPEISKENVTNFTNMSGNETNLINITNKTIPDKVTVSF